MKNQAKIVAIKGTSNPSKVQIEVTDFIEKGTAVSTNALSLFNAGDDKFAQAKAQHGWLTAEKAQVKALLGLDCTTITHGMVVPVERENKFTLPNGTEGSFRLQVEETTTLRKGGQAKYDTMTIGQGESKEMFLHEGALVYRYVDVIIGEPNHKFLENKVKVSAATILGDVANAQAAVSAMFDATK